MDAIDDETERALWWLVRLERNGHLPTPDELSTLVLGRKSSQIAEMMGLSRSPSILGKALWSETPADALMRLGLADDSTGGYLTATPLGRAVSTVLREESEFAAERDGGAGAPLIIEQRDDLALALLLNEFRTSGPGLLVDPYLTVQHLADAARTTQLDRFLTSDRDEKCLALLAMVVAGFPDIEVRAGAGLHDRHVITGDRVWMLGGSLNGAGKKHTSALVQVSDVGDVLRNEYERRWSVAARVEPHEGPGES